MVQYSEARLDSVLGAVADPTRRAILRRLTRGPTRISDAAAKFDMTLTGFCKHVRILERAGLVHRKREGRENTLTLRAQPMREAARWFLEYESFWNARLDRLEEFFKNENQEK